jgi:hypothetical protein
MLACGHVHTTVAEVFAGIMSLPAPNDDEIASTGERRLAPALYNAHGHKLRFFRNREAQFVTALGIITT